MLVEATNKPLTIKQESFAQKYIECGNASEAYRYAYNAQNMKPESVNVRASELLSDSKIRVRVEQLKSGIAKRNAITHDTILQRLKEESEYYGEGASHSARVSALTQIGKFIGMSETTKHEHTVSSNLQAALLMVQK